MTNPELKRQLLSAVLAVLYLQVGCLKRDLVAPDSPEIERHSGVVIVYMKPDKDYRGEPVVTLKSPQISDTFLSGSFRGEEIQIPIENIDGVEITKLDSGRVLRSTAVFVIMGVFLILSIYATIIKDLLGSN